MLDFLIFKFIQSDRPNLIQSDNLRVVLDMFLQLGLVDFFLIQSIVGWI